MRETKGKLHTADWFLGMHLFCSQKNKNHHLIRLSLVKQEEGKKEYKEVNGKKTFRKENIVWNVEKNPEIKDLTTKKEQWSGKS